MTYWSDICETKNAKFCMVGQQKSYIDNFLDRIWKSAEMSGISTIAMDAIYTGAKRVTHPECSRK